MSSMKYAIQFLVKLVVPIYGDGFSGEECVHR